MALSQKHKRFIVLVVEGEDQATAWKKAGFCDNAKTATAAASACRFLATPEAQIYRAHVEAERNGEYDKEILDKSLYTREALLGKLERAFRFAEEKKDGAVMIHAVNAQAKLAGLADININHNHRMRPDEAYRVIATLLPKYKHLLPAHLQVVDVIANDAETA